MMISGPPGKVIPARWATLLLLVVGWTVACGPKSEPHGSAEPSIPGATVASAEAPVPAVYVQPTVPRDVGMVASLPADLQPLRRATLSAETAGTVETLHVDAGDRVRQGALLLEIDTRALRQRVDEAVVIERLRRAELERAEKLHAKRSITQQQLLEATTAAEVAQLQLASAELVLEKSRLGAPWTGTLARRWVEEGDYVNPGQRVFELLEVGRLEVHAPAPASDVSHLAVGQEALVHVDGFSEPIVTQVHRLASELDTSARTLDVILRIDNRDGRLRPGMTARVEIPRQTLEGAILIPLDALIELEDVQTCYVVDGEGSEARAERRALELGPVIGREVVVEQGLGPGERLIVEGHRRVSPGQRVEVLDAQVSGAAAQGN